MRRLWLLLIGLGILAFLIVSALLARVYSADGAERSAITDLVGAEARGDESAMMNRLQGCRLSSSCRIRVAADVAALTRPGTVSILQLQTSTSFTLTASTGTARVAWKTASSLPIVQCVRVHRAGDVLSNWRIELLAISERITSNADCPRTF
jgi:hypothetical protein